MDFSAEGDRLAATSRFGACLGRVLASQQIVTVLVECFERLGAATHQLDARYQLVSITIISVQANLLAVRLGGFGQCIRHGRWRRRGRHRVSCAVCPCESNSPPVTNTNAPTPSARNRHILKAFTPFDVMTICLQNHSPVKACQIRRGPVTLRTESVRIVSGRSARCRGSCVASARRLGAPFRSAKAHSAPKFWTS